MSLTVNVAAGKESHAFELSSAELLVEELQQRIEDKTGVLVRKQKLIFKGKTLNPKNTLQQHSLKNGCKVLLIATDGVQKPAPAPSAPVKSGLLSKMFESAPPPKRASTAPGSVSLQVRAATWRKTGIVGLQAAGLVELPREVLQLGNTARLLDASNNQITGLTPDISQLVSLSSLKLSGNRLHQERIPWPFLGCLSSLTQLILDNNAMTELPDNIAQLTQLRELNLRGNALEKLPEDIWCLERLQHLDVGANKLTSLPDGLGCCTSLIGLDASDNVIAAVPPSLSRLQNLKSLKMQNNRVRQLPTTLLSSCSNLMTLQLHNNPMTLVELRSTPGFDDYDARRKAKIDKQLELDVLTDDASFNQGADEQQWERFSSFKKPQ